MFDLVVEEWDNGQPDALTLSTTKVDVDPDCEAVMGKLKVCNNNYGETSWRGTTQVFLDNDFIVWSVARLNDFYLDGADEAQRQFTMCHNIGHGFGLPHTDENFFNADLGNCMDYTSNPEVNKSPDMSNYAFLAEQYGVVGTRRTSIRGNYFKETTPANLNRGIGEARDQLTRFPRRSPAGQIRSTNELLSEFVSIDLGDGAQLHVHTVLEPSSYEGVVAGIDG